MGANERQPTHVRAAHPPRRLSQAEWDTVAWRVFRQMDLPVLKAKIEATLHFVFN